MMKKLVPIAAAAVALAYGTAATAQSNTDARCIVLSSAFSRAGPNDQAKQLAQAALNFYLGRVSPAASSAQLKTLFDQQMATINDSNDGPLMSECIKNFQAVVNVHIIRISPIRGSNGNFCPACVPCDCVDVSLFKRIAFIHINPTAIAIFSNKTPS